MFNFGIERPINPPENRNKDQEKAYKLMGRMEGVDEEISAILEAIDDLEERLDELVEKRNEYIFQIYALGEKI